MIVSKSNNNTDVMRMLWGNIHTNQHRNDAKSSLQCTIIITFIIITHKNEYLILTDCAVFSTTEEII